jgi:hypothetical protein
VADSCELTTPTNPTQTSIYRKMAALGACGARSWNFGNEKICWGVGSRVLGKGRGAWSVGLRASGVGRRAEAVGVGGDHFAG